MSGDLYSAWSVTSARAFMALVTDLSLVGTGEADPGLFCTPYRALVERLPGWAEEGEGSGHADPWERLTALLRSIPDEELKAADIAPKGGRGRILARVREAVNGDPLVDPLYELAACRQARDDAEDHYRALDIPTMPPKGPGAEPLDGGPVIVTASEVAPEQVRWWWRGRLALGKLTVVEGEPDVGKSSVLLDIAARVSTGRPMPDGAPAPEGPGDVLILAAAEDGVADTIVPRLMAAGADMDRVRIWEGTPAPGGYLRGFELAHDLAALEELILARGVRLVLVDALMAAMPGGHGTNRDPDTRRLLHPLAALAERTGVAVVLNRHHRKGAGKAIERGGGSIAIGAVARAVLAVVKDDTDESGERRLLGVVKANLLPEAEKRSTAYRIVGATVHDREGRPVETLRIEWLGQDERRIRDLLARSDDEVGGGEAGECAEAIRSLLADGPMLAKAAESDLREQGFSYPTIRRARDRVGVTRKAGTIFQVAIPGPWSWRLPDPPSDPPPPGAHPPLSTWEGATVEHPGENPVAMRDHGPAGPPENAPGAHPNPLSTWGAGEPSGDPSTLLPDDPSGDDHPGYGREP